MSVTEKKRMNCCTKKGYGNEKKRRFSHKMPKKIRNSFYVKDFIYEIKNAEMSESGRQHKKGFNGQLRII